MQLHLKILTVLPLDRLKQKSRKEGNDCRKDDKAADDQRWKTLDKAGPVVRCHDTALLLTEVKPEGGSAMDGASFLRGRPLRPVEDSLLSG